jgi:hypothetical protein
MITVLVVFKTSSGINGYVVKKQGASVMRIGEERKREKGIF